MASTLARGERIEIRGFGSFLCTIVLHVPGVTRKLVIKSSWKGSTFHTLSRVKNCAIAPIFTATEFSQPVKLGSKAPAGAFVSVTFILKVSRILSCVFCNALKPCSACCRLHFSYLTPRSICPHTATQKQGGSNGNSRFRHLRHSGDSPVTLVT